MSGSDLDDLTEPDYCLAVDMHNDRSLGLYMLCSKEKGHDGDHGNERFTWPARPRSAADRVEELLAHALHDQDGLLPSRVADAVAEQQVVALLADPALVRDLAVLAGAMEPREVVVPGGPTETWWRPTS